MYFSTVRISFLTVKHLWDFPVCGYRARTALNVCSGCLPEQYLFFLLPKFARNIRTYPLLLNAAEQYNPNGKQGSKKKFKGPKVSVINENNVGTYMYLEEAEKYANRNNLRLVELQASTREKPKYKLQRLSGVFETRNTNKVQSKKIKQILLREGIYKNDLLVKVNQMLKFLEKDYKVICVVECKNNEKLENIINEINTSGLQEYSCNKTQTGRGVKLIYKPKSSEPEQNS